MKLPEPHPLLLLMYIKSNWNILKVLIKLWIEWDDNENDLDKFEIVNVKMKAQWFY